MIHVQEDNIKAKYYMQWDKVSNKMIILANLYTLYIEALEKFHMELPKPNIMTPTHTKGACCMWQKIVGERSLNFAFTCSMYS